MRTERYGPIIPAARTRELRAARGLSEQPLAVIVSRRLDFDTTVPLLADPGSHVVIITPTPRDLPPCARSRRLRPRADAARGARRARRTPRGARRRLRGRPASERRRWRARI